MFGKENDDLFINTMFGVHARRVPMWMKVQETNDGGVMFVGASLQGKELMYGSKKTHQMIMGEIVVRPHMVFESDHCRGHGITGLAKEMEMEQWIKGLMIDPMGNGKNLKKDLGIV